MVGDGRQGQEGEAGGRQREGRGGGGEAGVVCLSSVDMVQLVC